MEKAILKTLIYADIFDYPLKAYEIHKWLIGRKATLRQAEKALEKLNIKYQILSIKGYYCLSKRANIISKRKRREKQSEWYLKKAKALTTILKLIPWIKLVGVSGGLAMENADKADDIDLFIITGKNRLWLSRFLTLTVLSLTTQRRKVTDRDRKAAGKLCVNILLEEDKLGQQKKDVFIAHEVLQMKVLWQKEGIYGKYLEDNQWAFKCLPNWVTQVQSDTPPAIAGSKFNFQRKGELVQSYSSKFKIIDFLEIIAKWLQLKIMKKPQGMERIQDGALYFHPNDYRLEILKSYKKKVKKLAGPKNSP